MNNNPVIKDHRKLIGARVRFFRKAAKMTQEKLAELAGFSEGSRSNAISQLEKSGKISLDKLLKIAHHLNIHPYLLLDPRPIPEDKLKLVNDFLLEVLPPQ